MHNILSKVLGLLDIFILVTAKVFSIVVYMAGAIIIASEQPAVYNYRALCIRSSIYKKYTITLVSSNTKTTYSI